MREVLLKEENLIDLSSVTSSENLLFELTNMLEKNKLKGKNLKINLGRIKLSHEQFFNMKSLLKGMETGIEMIYSESKETRYSAVEAGLTVSGKTFESLKEPEKEEPKEALEEVQLENIITNTTSEASVIKKETLYLKQTLRSGRKLEHDGNLVIIGDCNAGSEIVATGDILVWGILCGIAHAGAKGDYKACIRAFRINAIQLRIADLFARKPDKIDLDRTDKFHAFTPEEAKICEGEIVIYSLHQAYG